MRPISAGCLLLLACFCSTILFVLINDMSAANSRPPAEVDDEESDITPSDTDTALSDIEDLDFFRFLRSSKQEIQNPYMYVDANGTSLFKFDSVIM